MEKDTGGLAFPHEYGSTAPGMTLRDYFAAKALQGMFASGNIPKSARDEELAEVAYEMADAMLKVREQ